MPSIHVKEPVLPTEETNEQETTAEKNTVEAVSQPVSAASSATTHILPAHKDYRKFLIAGGAILLLLIAALFISMQNDRRQLKQEVSRLSAQSQKPSSPSQDQSQQEAEQLKKEIGQYLELPADEVPTVATVVDANKVKGQSFFTNTQNGDKVLLFAKSGKAILYRPSTKKIIEVAPINLNQTQPAAQGTSTGTNR